MKRDEIAKRVVAVTARELKLSTEQIKEEHHFAFDLGAESLKSPTRAQFSVELVR